MKRRTTFMLTGMMVLGLAVGGIAQLSFAQSSPLIGTWKLNLGKSRFSGPPPRSRTATFAQDGQNIRNTVQAIDAQGNPATVVLLHIYDGRPHPTMGISDFDASTYTRVDANTEIFARFNDGNTSSWSAPPSCRRTARRRPSRPQALEAALSPATTSSCTTSSSSGIAS